MKKNKLQLRDFQKEDVAFMKQHNYRVLVANGQGTGKTIECLAAISIDRKILCPVVIVCPSSVVWNWYNETRKWCKWARVHCVVKRKEPLPQQRQHIYIVSWALLPDRLDELLAIRPKLTIADEAQYAKNEDAIRSKALQQLTSKTPHILLLSGTPLINDISELESLHNIFGEKPPMIRRLLKDVAPDVPEKTRMTVPVYLRPRHAKEYIKAFEEFDKWLKEELQKKMDDGDAEEAARRALAAEALIKIGYLRRLVGIGKTYAAVDWVARAVRYGEPVVLFCEHGEVIRRIKKLLEKQNIPVAVVRGSTPKKVRQSHVEKFQKGEVAVFIGTKAAHTGITLTRARHLCFVERFWTSADEEQAEDRIRRISQKYKTKIRFLHAMGTVDDRIAEIIEHKRKLVAKTIGSEDVKDADEDAVMEIIANWSKNVSAPIVKGDSMLGLTKSLPPLPKESNVQAIIFKGKRWNESSARAWCRMNKYRPFVVKTSNKRIEVVLRNASNFVQHTINMQSVSKLITIVHGQRKKGKLIKAKVGRKPVFKATKKKRKTTKRMRY